MWAKLRDFIAEPGGTNCPQKVFLPPHYQNKIFYALLNTSMLAKYSINLINILMRYILYFYIYRPIYIALASRRAFWGVKFVISVQRDKVKCAQILHRERKEFFFFQNTIFSLIIKTVVVPNPSYIVHVSFTSSQEYFDTKH